MIHIRTKGRVKRARVTIAGRRAHGHRVGRNGVRIKLSAKATRTYTVRVVARTTRGTVTTTRRYRRCA